MLLPLVVSLCLSQTPALVHARTKHPGAEHHHRQHPKGNRPGTERWSIKTSVGRPSDEPKVVQITDLVHLHDVPGVRKDDARYQDNLIPNAVEGAPIPLAEGDVVQTTGWLHLVAMEDDGDYHIQISASPTDGNDCVVVEVPNDDPQYVEDPELRQQVARARDFIKQNLFKGKEPSKHGSVMVKAPYVTVTGQLFYDSAHVGDQPRGKRGMKAGTLWELHPVTDLRFAPLPSPATAGRGAP